MRINTILIAAALAASASSAGAVELVVNGGFETWGLGNQSGQFGTAYAPGETALAGWTTSGLTYVFVPGDNTAVGQYGDFQLYGPSNGYPNGLTTSSQGGNYVATDADRGFGTPITQLVSGFEVGKEYVVKFEWAAAQQLNYNGATFEAWQASILASNTTDLRTDQTIADYVTETVINPQAGFQPWRNESFRFTATEASHILRFWATGGPGGLPPFALLDGVSITAVPEPATWGLLITGFAMVGVAARRRRRVVAA
ncbi:PEPxxWA-CTERM sorting domain-containing protein [Glacieibacterium frigidum]|uniref:PEP-CTERM sorting domain-containing protein n=1 Tax=Glacieibacterium frigidum TaxID=2593303 RepID=A0A552UA50_9SPHN|nr:PEPxxWA-CTERM sorting domain-containing protein [Glacieibacterium frigidum]TRW15092.1 PEP-CTERM sorting domain-containing protein [Glacieibacterium frigidum]